MRRRLSRSVAIVLAVTALAAAGCRELPGSVGTPTGPKVIVIGDSFVFRARTEIVNLLVAAGYSVTLYGEEGLNTAWALELIDQAVARNPAAVVVITASNDATSMGPGPHLFGKQGARDPAEVHQTLTRAFEKLDGVPCTAWMLVDEHAPLPYFLYLPDEGPRLNSWTSQLAAARKPRARLLDWRNLIAEHPELADVDRLHVNAAGNQRLAEDINGAVAGCRR